jgi:hypothetical protein
MNPAVQAVICGRRRQLVTLPPFTSNATWTAPITTNRIEKASGKGAAGTPSSTAVRDASAQGDSVQGYSSGSGSQSGSFAWNDFQSDISSALNTVNAGGSGNGYVVTYSGYPNSNTYNISLYQYSFTGAIPGSAYVFTSPGWKSSGDVLPGDYGYFAIGYSQSYTIPATTGASATAFGQTFPGGAGGPATITEFTNVAITPGATYNIVVPAGGSVTISYFQ